MVMVPEKCIFVSEGAGVLGLGSDIKVMFLAVGPGFGISVAAAQD